MRFKIIILFVLVSKISFGQYLISGINYWNFNNSSFKSFTQSHSTIQPLIIYSVKEPDPIVPPKPDTIINGTDTIYRLPVQRIQKFDLNFNYKADIPFSISTETFAQIDTSFSFRSSIGFQFSKNWKKWMNKTRVHSGWSARETDNQVHSFILPLNNNSYYWYNDVRTRFGYNANKQLHISFGIDNQFFGEGYRSLIQSDQVAPNPFAMLRTKFWRFEYGLLYQFYHEQQTNSRYLKFNALHYLSYNVTDKFNISLFEQVLFPSKDGHLKRNFEVEYLNPIVFFRPQEYSIGSADNVLLALNTAYHFENSTLYGQIALDEFVLSEIRARSKWWANKYAVQLGYKGNHKRWMYRVEANLVRPYTYAHIDFSQNAGNLGRPNAHPLGSNFIELLAHTTYLFDKIGSVDVFGTFNLKGFDESGKSWGGDIYQNYAFRVKEYGNTIGQGLTQRSVLFGSVYRYYLHSKKKIFSSSFELYAQVNLQYSWGEKGNQFLPSTVIGVRNNLFQSRKPF